MKRAVFFAGILALMVMVGPASAIVFIDFGTGTGTGGNIAVAGGQAIGTNIAVDTMGVIGTAFDGVYNLFGTGGGGGANGSALLNFNTNTGAFSIVGGVCVLGNNTCTGLAGTFVTSTTLVTGIPPITNIAMPVLSSTNLTMSFQENDTKAASLFTALGVPTTTQFRLMSATFQGVSQGTGSPYTVNSTDVNNTSQVPEPTSILLLGSALVGLTNLVRRRSKKA